MTMSEIRRYCDEKAKRREAELVMQNAELDKIQEQIDNALAKIDEILNEESPDLLIIQT